MLFQTIESKVIKAQSDSELLEKLIAAHQGFIKKCMIDQQKASGAQLEDEMTVAMLAFTEAVKQYDLSRGKFLGFARLIINRRMIDEYRRLLRQTPMGAKSLDEAYMDDEGNQDMHPYEVAASLSAHEAEVKKRDLQMEIALYQEALSAFGLNFNDLVDESPKQEALRRTYQDLAKWMVKEPDLMKQLNETKKMPISQILERITIDKKRLERGRKYIIALVVLLESDLELIKQYLERR